MLCIVLKDYSLRDKSIAIKGTITLFIILLICISCKQKKSRDKVILSWIGKEFLFVDTLPVFNPIIENFSTTAKTLINNNTPTDRLVIYIDAQCFTCFQDLIDWKLLFNKLNLTDNQILIYLSMKDLTTVSSYFKKWNFNYPIIYDKNKIVYRLNRISDDRLYQVFILDKENIVKFVGNPILNSNIEKFYISYFNNPR